MLRDDIKRPLVSRLDFFAIDTRNKAVSSRFESS